MLVKSKIDFVKNVVAFLSINEHYDVGWSKTDVVMRTTHR